MEDCGAGFVAAGAGDEGAILEGEECVDGFVVTVLHGAVERGDAGTSGVEGPWLGAVLQEETDDVGMAGGGCPVEGCLAVGVGCGGVVAIGEREAGEVEAAVLCGYVEGGIAVDAVEDRGGFEGGAEEL